jgi:hypothetical protein
MYSMRTPRGEMKTRPTPNPSFMTEPSKYIVHVSCSIGVGGVWISVHSTMSCRYLGLDGTAGRI